MQAENTNLQFEKEFSYRYSVCTIVTDPGEYRLMQESFVKKGFEAGCRYLTVDNTRGNKFDAYHAVRRFLQESAAEYTLIVHQDVRCVDHIRILDECLASLEAKDPNWAVCGNAGATDYKKMVYYLDNNGDVRKSADLPARVFSLDENFLLIKSKAHLSVSGDISGFHFYGTDLCIIADLLGYTSYVIPFMVNHLSKGNLADMERHKASFIKKYGDKLRSRFIQTTCTNFYLAGSAGKNNFLNAGPVFFLIKAGRRLRNLFR